MNYHSPDLTQHPPRSARVRLGGYVILPRMIDKGRATLAGKNGEYHYACPMDQRLLDFLGLDAEALKKAIAAGKSDGELLAWIREQSRNKYRDAEVLAWSAQQEQRVPTDPETRAFFNELHTKAGPQREDIAGWFDLLDLDDFVSYGGKA